MSTIAPLYHKPHFPCLSLDVCLEKKNALVQNHYCNLLKSTQTYKSAADSSMTNNVAHLITTELPFNECKGELKIYGKWADAHTVI